MIFLCISDYQQEVPLEGYRQLVVALCALVGSAICEARLKLQHWVPLLQAFLYNFAHRQDLKTQKHFH